MTIVQNITSTATSQENTLPTASKQMLDQDDFMKLMIAQMQNQDPTKPVEGQEYLGQLAQFSTLSSIQELQKSFDTLAQSLMTFQTTQATSMVGKQVLVESDRGYYTSGQTLSGKITLPEDVSNLTVRVYTANGQLVNTMNLGSQQAGQQDFNWGGTGAVGPGVYRVTAEGQIDDQNQQFGVQVWNQVESISVGQSGQSASLALAGGVGLVDMSAVRAIR